MSDEIDLEIKSLQKVYFFGQDLLGRDGSVSNLFRHDFGMKWINIFIFGSQIHRSNSNAMNIFIDNFATIFLDSLKIVIKYLDSEEIGTRGAFEGSANFYHPVSHLRSVLLGYIMTFNGLIN